jgi:biotin transport system substrate-specific component
MTNLRLQAQRAATVEVVGNIWVRRVLAVIAFAVMTGLAAFAEVRLPGIPVPVTLQTIFVSLAGVLLGPALGASAMMTYVLAGAAGLPVFAGGAFGLPYLFGPTGGYLLAFAPAAYVTGVLADRVDPRGLIGALRLAVAIFLGTAVVFAGGAAQLAILTGDPALAIRLGVLPFIAGDVVKVFVTLLVARRLGDRVRRLV